MPVLTSSDVSSFPFFAMKHCNQVLSAILQKQDVTSL